VVAPVEHAGTQPVLVARHTDDPSRGAVDDPSRGAVGGPGHSAEGGSITASVLCPAGFMSASGPLTARHPGSFPSMAGARAPARLAPVTGPRWSEPLPVPAYRDLWYAAGVWSRRATHAAVRGLEQSVLALLNEARTGGAIVLPDGAILAGGPEAARYAAIAEGIVDRWESAGRPAMDSWRITFARAGDPRTPIWVPAGWAL
jgi:protein-L-isoaspartate(D-aspartate) O-methyltransferase